MTDYLGKTLLVVGAHPDDETLGLGRTIAKYTRLGVKVYYACATRGESGTVDDVFLQGFSCIGDLRWSELLKAGKKLGISGIYHLGFRDSGLLGWDDNNHPDSLFQASEEKRIDAVVKIIRELKPDVVVTHDCNGGYGHPDHIAISKATEDAVKISSDDSYKPELGSPWIVKKFYYSIINYKLLKHRIFWIKFAGKDPHHLGRNKDIDWAAMLDDELPTNAKLSFIKQDFVAFENAKSCYPSQVTKVNSMDVLNSLYGKNDYFMRLKPEADENVMETDLFEGI